ncbi:MAG TPA: TonB-dependent receptor [Vicinamibacterales bacterium]|nr:TonB-dependent receptor [Vicinamibacterales bacterium]
MISAILLAFLFSFQSPAISAHPQISGTVTDPAGRAVPRARVAAVVGRRVASVAVAGPDGRFTLTPPADRFELIVTAPGLRAAPIAVDAARDREVAIVMSLAAVADSVIVSAAQVDVPLSRVTDSVDVIDGAAIRARQAENVAEALRSVPGLGVTSSGGRGAVTSIFTRGGESDYTLVLVDGIPLNEFGGSLDIAHLSPAGVDRIEVVRGPQGALHGSGAIAGVVQVVSAAGGRTAGSVQLEAGSDALRRALADARGSAGAWSLGGGADIIAADGFTGLASDGSRVSNDDYRRAEASGVVSRDVARAGHARATARWNDNERGFPGAFGSNPAGNYGGIDTMSRGANTQAAAGVALDAAAGAVSHRVSATWMRLESDFASPFGDSTSGARRASLRYAADWALSGGLGVTAGADVARESGRSTFIVDRAGAEIPVERTIAGYFAEARGAAGSRMLFTAGARLDQIHRGALAGDASPFGARPDMPADTVWAFNPRLSAVAYLTSPAAPDTTRVRAGFSTGIKPPSAFELSFTDNPALNPERNRSAELAIEQTLARGAVHLAAAAFWNRYDDLIITVGRSLAGASPYRSDNLSNSHARGLELSAAARGAGRLAGVTVRGGYAWLRTEILAADGVPVTGLAPFEVGDRLPRRPRHRGFVDAGFARGSLSAFFTVDARGRTLDIEPSFGLFGGLFENPGYASSSAGASWQVGRRVTLFGRVTNLFDRRYEEIFGFPAPGRRAAGGVRIAAGR